MSQRKPTKQSSYEPDSVFFFKILLYFIFGTLWLRLDGLSLAGGEITAGIPVGLLLGMIFAHHDHFQIDRKIEYVVLIISTIISFYLPVGILVEL